MSTSHALIITSRIQEACGNGQYACEIYVDFKKAFGMVNHNTLLDKLAHYGVRGIENNWFKTYLTNRKQHVTVRGKNIWQCVDRLWGPTVHHFADDTNLLLVDNSLRKDKQTY